MEDQEPKIKPHSGAPRGNHNALKHGFYSRQFDTRDNTDLTETSQDSVDSEIALLRVNIRRLLLSYRDVDDYKRLTDLNRSLCLSALTLGRLIRIRLILKSDHSQDEADFDAAVKELFGHRAIFQDQNSPPKDLPPSPTP